MGTIDKQVFEKAGAKGTDHSEYHLGHTTCCGYYVVADKALDIIYYDPENIESVLGSMEQDACPICQEKEWGFEELKELPELPTRWQWAYCAETDVTEDDY